MPGPWHQCGSVWRKIWRSRKKRGIYTKKQYLASKKKTAAGKKGIKRRGVKRKGR